MDDLDDLIAEPMKTCGLRLAWPERRALVEQAALPAQRFVLDRLREMSAVRAAWVLGPQVARALSAVGVETRVLLPFHGAIQ